MDAAEGSVGGEVDHRRADDGDEWLAPDPRQLAREALGERGVVRVEPGDVPPARLVEAAVERGCEPEALVVPDDDEPSVGNRLEDCRRSVGRGVVDDDQLQVAHRLTEDALQGEREKLLAVVRGEQDGDERRWPGVHRR